MILPAGRARVYVCAEPVDMRRGIDGLSALVQPMLQQDLPGGVVGKLADQGVALLFAVGVGHEEGPVG